MGRRGGVGFECNVEVQCGRKIVFGVWIHM